MIKFVRRHNNLFYYIGAGVLYTGLSLLLYRNFINVGFLFHDYNFFRDYPEFLNPITGGRWQPVVYIANWAVINIFHFNPFWPKLIVFIFYCLNFVLALWFLNLLTNKKVQNEIRPYCTRINPESQVYLINFPKFINNQVFIFNNGLGGIVRLICQKHNWGFYQIENSQLGVLLKESNTLDEPAENMLILAYENDKIIDYSHKYLTLTDFLGKFPNHEKEKNLSLSAGLQCGQDLRKNHSGSPEANF